MLISLFLFSFLAALLVAACDTLSMPAVETTLVAERDGYIAEATAIQVAISARSAEVSATAAAAATHASHQRGVNALLYATVQAAVTPSPQVVADTAGLNTPSAILQGERWFVKTGMTDSVRESDGCLTTAAIQFPNTASRIYATFKAFHINAGTPLAVTWSHEGRVVLEESFRIERSASEICLWFYIDPTIVNFSPGSWSVQLYADGFRLESPMNFRIDASAP